LPSDNEGNIAIDKSDASFHPNGIQILSF